MYHSNKSIKTCTYFSFLCFGLLHLCSPPIVMDWLLFLLKPSSQIVNGYGWIDATPLMGRPFDCTIFRVIICWGYLSIYYCWELGNSFSSIELAPYFLDMNGPRDRLKSTLMGINMKMRKIKLNFLIFWLFSSIITYQTKYFERNIKKLLDHDYLC